MPDPHMTATIGTHSSANGTGAILVDYDNFCAGVYDSQSALTHALNRMVDLALAQAPELGEIRVRLYGGWLDSGVLTKRASRLQQKLSQPFFPRPHPDGRLIRGSVDLVTRLVGVPGLEWGHTFRERRGLPRLRLAETPRPSACAGDANCPIDLVQRISRRRARACHIAGCSVANRDAFLLQEQKMVDSMLCCDALTLAARVEVGEAHAATLGDGALHKAEHLAVGSARDRPRARDLTQ